MIVHDDWLLTPQRAAVHRPTATAVLADLHLGYAEARRRRGEAVPAGNLVELLRGLQSLCIGHDIRRLVIAGDLFEDGRYAATAELASQVRAMGLEVAGVVPGNHDRGFGREPPPFPVFSDGFDLGGWKVVHGDGRLPRGPVVHGHLHPCFRWQGVTAPCYVIGRRKLILPAFSPDAAGGNVLAMPELRTMECAVIAGDEVLHMGKVGDLVWRKRNVAGIPAESRPRSPSRRG